MKFVKNALSFSRFMDEVVAHPVFVFLFALGMVSLTFKQLKYNEFAGGIEVFSACLVLIALGTGRWLFGSEAWKIATVGFMIFFALMLGTIVSFFQNSDFSGTRDLVAFIFTFSATFAFIAIAHRHNDYTFQIVGEVIGLYCGLIAVLSFLPVYESFWYYGVRLQGLSDNPNQIAFLALTGLGLLCLPVRGSDHHFSVLRTLITAAGCVAAGILTRSDAFLLSLVFVAVLSLGVVLFKITKKKSASVTVSLPQVPQSLTKSLGIFVFCVLGIIASFSTDAEFWPLSADQMLEGEGGQGHFRLELWASAIETFGTSPIVGLGTGTHVPNPARNGELTEAHNTLLDLLVNSGLVGTTPIIILISVVLWRAVRGGNLLQLLLVVLPLLLFSMFHFVARQPLLWILLLGCVWSVGMLKLSGPEKEKEEAH